MALLDRLREKSSAVAENWQRRALAVYSETTCRAYQSQQDPFANPVGHALRSGTRAAVEGLVAGRELSEVLAALDEIIKIRAVQEIPPSEAIAFVFSFKDVVREELAAEASTAASYAEFSDLDQRIDRLALGAFDVYTRYRNQICELRISELKRSMGRFQGIEP